MKKIMIMAMLLVVTITANAMNYNKAKNEALFISDKMAYELNLTNAQYNAVYEINLDYLLCVNDRNDINGRWWMRRDTDLKYVLNAWQYERYIKTEYFYRPVAWRSGTWYFNIYTKYNNRNRYYKARPVVYDSYKGGNNRKATRFYADRKINKPAINKVRPNNAPVIRKGRVNNVNVNSVRKTPDYKNTPNTKKEVKPNIPNNKRNYR